MGCLPSEQVFRGTSVVWEDCTRSCRRGFGWLAMTGAWGGPATLKVMCLNG